MSLEILTRRPARTSRAAPLLFVHGAFVGAWCWEEHFLPYFAARGYDAHAVSLRGHGGSPAGGPLDLAGLDDYVADVAMAAGGLDAPPVLIGHSMGAIVVQRAAQRCRAPALALVAPVPPHGLSSSLLSLAARDLQLFMALNTFQADGGTLSPALARIRECLFSKALPEAEVRRHLARMQHESQRALMDLMWPQHLWLRSSRGLPVVVVGAAEDTLCPVPMVEEAARFHSAEPAIFDAMAHAMMLEAGWEDVARHLGAWLDAQAFARAA